MLKDMLKWLTTTKAGREHQRVMKMKADAFAQTRRVQNYADREKRARIENPAVKDAWEKYQITLKLTIGEEMPFEKARPVKLNTDDPGPY